MVMNASPIQLVFVWRIWWGLLGGWARVIEVCIDKTPTLWYGLECMGWGFRCSAEA